MIFRVQCSVVPERFRVVLWDVPVSRKSSEYPADHGVLVPADVAAFTGDDPIYLSPITIAELKLGPKAPQMRESGRSA